MKKTLAAASAAALLAGGCALPVHQDSAANAPAAVSQSALHSAAHWNGLARDVAQREIGLAAFGERAQRLTLEVEQDPAALGRVEHLAEVVVAVHALQARPRGRRGAREDVLDPIRVSLQTGGLGQCRVEP